MSGDGSDMNLVLSREDRHVDYRAAETVVMSAQARLGFLDKNHGLIGYLCVDSDSGTIRGSPIFMEKYLPNGNGSSSAGVYAYVAAVEEVISTLDPDGKRLRGMPPIGDRSDSEDTLFA